MKKTVLTFGLISGVISIGLMLVNVAFIEKIGFDRGMVVGYTAIVAGFMLVFFGIKSYRDNVAGGTVSFGKAFQVGILITLVSSAVYVATWMVVHKAYFPDFMDQWAAHEIQKSKASGASPMEIQKQTEEMAKYKEWYKNPLMVAAMTFMEPFPVGLIITLVSAGILRRRTGTQPSTASALA